MENINEHIVADYIKSYKSKRLEGLKIAHGSGASKKINEAQEKIILETVTTKTPKMLDLKLKRIGLLN
jgi:transposase